MKVVFIKFLYYFIIISGSSLSIFLIIGLFVDLRGIDKVVNSPESLQSEVIISSDSFIFEKTEEGVIKHGIMSDYRVDCSNGLVTLKIHGGSKLDYSLFLEGGFYKEIFQKYTPRDICIIGGHSPEF